MSPLAAAVVTLTAVYLTLTTDACMETVRSSGYLSEKVTINAFTLTSKEGTSCQCCALCYQNSACASLSYNADTRGCQLYSSVAGYDTLTPDDSWKYFVIPGRSQHHQFCRVNSDCQEKGDFCRGRVCTELTAVTCRVIFETFGAGGRYGRHIMMHGWLGDRPLMLKCFMENGLGFTQLLRNEKGVILTRGNVSRFNHYPVGTSPHSILYLAEKIRLTRDNLTYQMLIRSAKEITARFDAVPRQTPVLTDTPRQEPWGKITNNSKDDPTLDAISLPFRPNEGINLILVNVLEMGRMVGTRSLARTDGQFWHKLLESISIYIRE